VLDGCDAIVMGDGIAATTSAAAASASTIIIVSSSEKRLLTCRSTMGINTHKCSNATPDGDGHQDRVDQQSHSNNHGQKFESEMQISSEEKGGSKGAKVAKVAKVGRVAKKEVRNKKEQFTSEKKRPSK
jgi:hypothetical protein